MNFKLIEIESIENLPFKGKVYDLEIENDHSYNVNGIIVHNSDFVMAGTFFAGHEESGGKLIEKEYYTDEVKYDSIKNESDIVFPTNVIETKKYKEVYGMSSTYAMEKYYGKKDDYRASEGEYNLIPYKGNINKTIEEVLGGIRSTATYIGAKRVKDIPKCATFIRVNRIK